MRSEIKDIETRALNYTINGLSAPTSIYEFDELGDIYGHSDLVDKVKNGEIQLLIPNHLLYSNFKETATKKFRRLSDFFTFFPSLLALSLTIVGIYHKHYWAASTIPLVFISFYLTAFLFNWTICILCLVFSIYLMILGNYTIGAILATITISMASAVFLRIVRRNAFVYSSLNSEILFCFLFYARTVSVYDTERKIVIKSR